jgi:hypothetical protein
MSHNSDDFNTDTAVSRARFHLAEGPQGVRCVA